MPKAFVWVDFTAENAEGAENHRDLPLRSQRTLRFDVNARPTELWQCD